MSWIAQGYIAPNNFKFFDNYSLPYTQMYYRGIGEDAGFYCYYLSPIGYIISQSFFPFKITINGINATTDFRGYNGYYRYSADYFKLYYSSIGFIVIQTSTDSIYTWQGCDPISYKYTDENNASQTVGTAYYKGSLKVGTNRFIGYNSLKDTTAEVKIELNYYENSGSGYFFNVADRSKVKIFGNPIYQPDNGVDTIYKRVDLNSSGIAYENQSKTFQIYKKSNKLIYGTQNSASGWWQCAIPNGTENFTLVFKKPKNSDATGKNIFCKCLGLNSIQNLQSTEAYYGDLLRWM